MPCQHVPERKKVLLHVEQFCSDKSLLCNALYMHCAYSYSPKSNDISIFLNTTSAICMSCVSLKINIQTAAGANEISFTLAFTRNEENKPTGKTLG